MSGETPHLGSPSYYPGDPTNIIAKRAWAKIIDSIIATVIGLIGFASIIASFHSEAVTDAAGYCASAVSGGRQCLVVSPTQVLVYNQPSAFWSLAWVGWWLIVAWLEGRYGWTFGKLILGIRVVRDSTGQPCGFGRSVARNLLWFVDSIVFGLIAVSVAKRSPGHQRLGDRAAGTLVVEREAFGKRLHPSLYEEQSVTTGALPADHPIWDPARSTYIIFDSPSGEWLIWNDAGHRWDPLTHR